MRITADKAKRICCIWIDGSEKYNYKSSDVYNNAVNEYKAKQYEVCVFVGGESPLLPVIDLLLQQQGF